MFKWAEPLRFKWRVFKSGFRHAQERHDESGLVEDCFSCHYFAIEKAKGHRWSGRYRTSDGPKPTDLCSNCGEQRRFHVE